MDAMLESIGDVVAVEPEAEVQPGSTLPDDAGIEAELTQEISTLWSQHTRLNADRRATAADLRQIRMALAARLAAMKSLLCRPDLGRASQWRGWLTQQGIPRSTADRLVAHHFETLGHDESVPNGAPSEPDTPSPEKMAETVWRSVRKVLVTSEAVIAFITSIAGLDCEERQDGLLICDVGQPADELTGSAPATDAATQPPDGISAITDEPVEENADAPLGAEQIVAGAEATVGAAA